MAEVWDNVTGARYWQDDDTGDITFAPEAGMLALAGRQFADLGAYDLVGANQNPSFPEVRQENLQARNAAFRGADMADPIRDIVGQALPGMATAPLSAGSLAGSLALNAGLGAAESGLDVGEGGTLLQRSLAGGLAGVAGDVGGRLVSRVARGVKGFLDDAAAGIMGRKAADNPLAQAWEEMGGGTTASQRMKQGTPEQKTMARLEQGAESALNPPQIFSQLDAQNQAVYRSFIEDAIGLPPGAYPDLGPQALADATDAISEGFSQVAGEVAQGGPIRVGKKLANRIAGTRGQIRDLVTRGKFAGLGDGVLQGDEWSVARRALAQDAANAASNGQYELAEDIFKDIGKMDDLVKDRLSPGTLPYYARLREQYRVLELVQKSGVIGADGRINPRRLNTVLQQGTGFGKTAKLGRDTVNDESKRLIDMARLARSDDFKPFQSSGTSERQQLGRFTSGLLDFPVGTAQAVAGLGAPTAVGVSSLGGGRAVSGFATRAAQPNLLTGQGISRMAGQGAGRGLLDELLYPFVGIKDDSQQ